MKISEKEKKLFDYMQEQANNLLDYCERNGVEVENPGFFVSPEDGFASISAGATDNNGKYVLCRNKSHTKFGGTWDTGVRVEKYETEQNNE